MGLQVGDFVAWVDEARLGTVTKLHPNGSVDARCTDGMDWPATQQKALVLRKRAQPLPKTPEPEIIPLPTPVPLAEPTPVHQRFAIKVPSLLVVPIDPERLLDEGVILMAVNPLGAHMRLVLSFDDGTEHQLVWNGEVGANGKVELMHLKSANEGLGMLDRFRAEALFYHPLGFEPRQPVAISIKLSSRKLLNLGAYKHYVGIPGAALAIELINPKPETVGHISIQPPKVTKASTDTLGALLQAEPRIDLHLEKLIESDHGLTDHEKLIIQIKQCEKQLDRAVAQGRASIVFIHGIGTGRLQQEVHRIARFRKLRSMVLANPGETRVYLL